MLAVHCHFRLEFFTNVLAISRVDCVIYAKNFFIFQWRIESRYYGLDKLSWCRVVNAELTMHEKVGSIWNVEVTIDFENFLKNKRPIRKYLTGWTNKKSQICHRWRLITFIITGYAGKDLKQTLHWEKKDVLVQRPQEMVRWPFYSTVPSGSPEDYNCRR